MHTWLLHNALCALALAIAALVLDRVARRRPGLRHLVWTVVLLRLVVPPLGALAPGPATTPPNVAEPPPAIATALQAASDYLATHLRPDWASWIPWVLLCAWGAGAAAVLVRQTRSVLQIRRRVAAGTRAGAEVRERVRSAARRMGVVEPRIVVLADATSPSVWVLGRPVLVLPPGEVPDDTVLAHELAHLRRGDPWVAWLEVAALVIQWWNPVLALVRSRVRLAAEEACDAWVLQVHPGRRRAYGRSLLTALEREIPGPVQTPALHATGLGRRALEHRLELLADTATRPHVSGLVAAVAVAAGALSLPGLAAPTLSALEARLPAFPRVTSAGAMLDHYGAQSWEDLSGAQEAHLADEPEDGAAWQLRGIAKLGERDFDEAVRSFERQEACGFQIHLARYNKACTLARAGKPNEALDTLAAAFEVGEFSADLIRIDPDLVSLRSDPRFQELVAGL